MTATPHLPGSVFLLWFLLIFVLLDVTAGTTIESTRGHFRRKDFPEGEKLTATEVKNKTKPRTEVSKTRVHPIKNENQDIYMTVKSQTRTTVILHCNKTKLDPQGIENTTVLWIRLRKDSFSILTDGNKTLIYDKRFLSTNAVHPEDWTLHIRYTRLDDQGQYKCVLCAEGNSSRNIYFNRSIYVNLFLVEAYATIIGDPVRNVDKVGSPLRLSCELLNSTKPPSYIYWYRGGRVINYDLGDGATVRDGRQGSELIFPRAQKKHEGNYSCVPSNARQASVLVIINANTYDSVGDTTNAGGKSYPRHFFVINMLLMMSTFLHYR